jgi:hypothetical protein
MASETASPIRGWFAPIRFPPLTSVGFQRIR